AGDELLQKSGAAEQAIVQAVFKALVKRNVYTENKYLSRPSMVETIAGLAGVSVDKLAKAIAPFREKQFIKPDSGELDAFSTLEIGQDTLWEEWGTFKLWIQAESRDAAILIKLDKAAEKRESDASAPLLSGKNLQEASDWFKRFAPRAVWAEQYIFDAERPFEYLKASQKAAGITPPPPKPKPKPPTTPEDTSAKARPQIKIGGSKEDEPQQKPLKEGERPKISIKSRKKS
ncbi:MAG: hypothetical protein AAFV07_12685, partial [Bacteroidota bacterium]